ncbi:hypothetical protein BH11BAC4_BH11BAC4_13050 [soil metagenome]
MTRTINWLFIIAGTFIMIYVMTSTGRTLKTPATPLGIVDLEFAYNTTKTDKVIKTWSITGDANVDNIKVAIKNTWLDFIFLFFYALFLFYSCKSIAESFNGFLQMLGKILAIGALNAGLLDIAENAGMLFTLNGFSSDSIAFFTTLCSVIKWLLALLALAYILLFGPLFLIRKLKKPVQ